MLKQKNSTILLLALVLDTMFVSGVASIIGAKGAECPPLTAKKMSKIGEKRGKSGKSEEKSGKN